MGDEFMRWGEYSNIRGSFRQPIFDLLTHSSAMCTLENQAHTCYHINVFYFTQIYARF